MFSIAICHQTGDKWQPGKLFLTIFDRRSLILLTFLIAAYPVGFRNSWYYNNDLRNAKGFTLTLQETRSIHDSMNLQKI